MLLYKLVYLIENYIIADKGEILTGWPERLDAKDFRFSGMYKGYIVVSYVPMNKLLPQSNVFKSQLLEWKQNNCFAPLGHLKTM